MEVIKGKNDRLFDSYKKLGFTDSQAKHVVAAVAKAELTDGQQAALLWATKKFISENADTAKLAHKSPENMTDIVNNFTLSFLKEYSGLPPVKDRLETLEKQYKNNLFSEMPPKAERSSTR